jgi:hypothetical protein
MDLRFQKKIFYALCISFLHFLRAVEIFFPPRIPQYHEKLRCRIGIPEKEETEKKKKKKN